MSGLTALFISKNESLKTELNKAVAFGTSYDAIVIELNTTDSISLSDMASVMSQSSRLLVGRGILLLLSTNCAIAYGKDELSTGFVARCFDSPSAVLTRFPLLGRFLLEKLPNIKRQYPELIVSLFEHILFTSVPMRCTSDRQLDWTGIHEERLLYDTIDGATSVEQLIAGLSKKHKMNRDSTLAALESLERRGLIYPLLPRAEFLSSCYKARRPFRLGHYMVAAGILSQGQLQIALEKQAEEVETSGRKPLLGQLVVKAGLISEPLLKSLLEDQFFFGGSQVLASAGILGDEGGGIKTFHEALMGTLSAIDAPSLLKSISAVKKDGLLVVEQGNKSMLIKFEDGDPSAAMLGELAGDEAIMEFLMSWSEGSFVFRKQDANVKLPGLCDVASPLKKLVLDAACAQNMALKIGADFPANRKTVLERSADFNQNWIRLDRSQCKMVDGTILSPLQWSILEELVNCVDGTATVEQLVENFSKWPCHLSLMGLHFLFKHGLLISKQGLAYSPARPLASM